MDPVKVLLTMGTIPRPILPTRIVNLVLPLVRALIKQLPGKDMEIAMLLFVPRFLSRLLNFGTKSPELTLSGQAPFLLFLKVPLLMAFPKLTMVTLFPPRIAFLLVPLTSVPRLVVRWTRVTIRLLETLGPIRPVESFPHLLSPIPGRPIKAVANVVFLALEKCLRPILGAAIVTSPLRTTVLPKVRPTITLRVLLVIVLPLKRTLTTWWGVPFPWNLGTPIRPVTWVIVRPNFPIIILVGILTASRIPRRLSVLVPMPTKNTFFHIGKRACFPTHCI